MDLALGFQSVAIIKSQQLRQKLQKTCLHFAIARITSVTIIIKHHQTKQPKCVGEDGFNCFSAEKKELEQTEAATLKPPC